MVLELWCGWFRRESRGVRWLLSTGGGDGVREEIGEGREEEKRWSLWREREAAVEGGAVRGV